jgi:hypothetical protein
MYRFVERSKPHVEGIAAESSAKVKIFRSAAFGAP